MCYKVSPGPVRIVRVLALGSSRQLSDKIAAERQSKDEMFRSGPESPIKPGELDQFVPLAYFRSTKLYAVPAQLQPPPNA